MTHEEAKKMGATHCDDVTPVDVWDSVPNGATHYSDLDNEIVYYQVTNNILYWDNDYNTWDEVYFDMPELKNL